MSAKTPAVSNDRLYNPAQPDLSIPLDTPAWIAWLDAPTTTGFDRTAWIVPFVALGLGLSIVVLVIRAWKNRPAPAIADGLRPVRGAELEQFRDQARKDTDL